MGFRFRKSIKVAPGIRLNLTKKGISSVSIAGINIGKRGIYKNFDIPGTGLSYRAKLAGGSRSAQSSKEQDKTPINLDMADLELNEDGSIAFLDEKGKLLPAAQVQLIKKQHREQLEAWLEERCEAYNGEIEAVIRIHLTTPAPTGEVEVNPKPHMTAVPEPGFISKLFNSSRQEEEAEDAQQDYEASLRQWEMAEEALHTDTEVMSAILSEALTTIEWPRETLVSFDVVEAGSKVLLDVDLPEIEDMPAQEARVNKQKLRLTIKERSLKQQRLDYLTHIHAVGFRFIGDVFAHLPSVNMVVLSGYSQRVNTKTGHVVDDYLYSVRVERPLWEQINFDNLEAIDVVTCFEQFELRRKMKSNGTLSSIEPFAS